MLLNLKTYSKASAHISVALAQIVMWINETERELKKNKIKE